MSVPRRVYSRCLMSRRLVNSSLSQMETVPEGHHWILKNLVWHEASDQDGVIVSYALVVSVIYAGTEPAGELHRVITDWKLWGQHPGEWEGRICLGPGDQLLLFNATTPYDNQGSITVSVHGFDFIGD